MFSALPPKPLVPLHAVTGDSVVEQCGVALDQCNRQELLDIFTNYRPVKKWQVDNVEIDMGLGWVGGDYGLWIKDISFVFGLKFNLRC